MNTITLNNQTFIAKPANGTINLESRKYGLCTGCAFKDDSIACGKSAIIEPCDSVIRDDKQNIIWVRQ